MGKMKELWQRMREKEMYEMEYGIPQEPLTIEIPCPECDAKTLIFNTTKDIICSECDKTFLLVDATKVELRRK